MSLEKHVARFNEGVRAGEFGAMVAAFSEDAELRFEGIPVGPFVGREAIADAYRPSRRTMRSCSWTRTEPTRGPGSRLFRRGGCP
jgi:hypothetical protein